MKQALLNLKYRCLVGICSMAALLGCSNDDSNCYSDASEAELTLTLSYSGLSPTRALTTSLEKTVTYLDVLAFKVTSGEEEYAYKTHATVISGSVARVKIQVDEANTYRFAFFANLEAEIAALVAADSFNEGDSKASVLSKIQFAAYTSGATDKTWNTTTPRYLPMWGENATPATVISSTKSLGTIYMLRAVATVDVLLDADMTNWNADDPVLTAPLTGFELKEVRVYNVPDIGRAAPDADNVENIYASGMNATMPTVPTAFTPYDDDYITYIPNDNLHIQKRVYIPEAFNNSYDGSGNATMLAYNNRTCLVVQILNTTTNKASWYRMDFVKKKTNSTDDDAVWDVLRNHRYRFYITAIKGDGYETPEEAYKSTAVNLESEVIDWNNADNNTIIIYGKNYVSYNGDGAIIVADQQHSTTRFYFETDALTWESGLPTNLTMTLNGSTTATNLTTVSNERFTVELVRDGNTESYYFLVTAKAGYAYPTDTAAKAELSLTFGHIAFSLDITQTPNNWNEGNDFETEF